MASQSQIRETLLRHRKSLCSRYPIKSIGLFGSVVRDDFSEESDIDIIVEFSGPIGIRFIALADELDQILGRKVDLVSRRGVKQKYLNAIEREVQLV